MTCLSDSLSLVCNRNNITIETLDSAEQNTEIIMGSEVYGNFKASNTSKNLL
jgi:hypothetical protein